MEPINLTQLRELREFYEDADPAQITVPVPVDTLLALIDIAQAAHDADKLELYESPLEHPTIGHLREALARTTP